MHIESFSFMFMMITLSLFAIVGTFANGNVIFRHIMLFSCCYMYLHNICGIMVKTRIYCISPVFFIFRIMHDTIIFFTFFPSFVLYLICVFVVFVTIRFLCGYSRFFIYV